MYCPPIKVKVLELDPLDPVKIEKFLKVNCKPFIKEMVTGSSTRWLWRGDYRDPAGSAVICRTQVPKEFDTNYSQGNEFFQEVAGDYFELKFGRDFRQSNISYTTTSSKYASVWGDVYAVIPIGEYSYLYSKGLEDVTMWGETEEEVWAYLKARTWTKDKGLTRILNTSTEVMLGCYSFVLIPEKLWLKVAAILFKT